MYQKWQIILVLTIAVVLPSRAALIAGWNFNNGDSRAALFYPPCLYLRIIIRDLLICRV